MFWPSTREAITPVAASSGSNSLVVAVARNSASVKRENSARSALTL